MTREEAIGIVWETHDMYFEIHPRAKRFTPAALHPLLSVVLPTQTEHDAFYEALGLPVCVQCMVEAGMDPETFCHWCAACAIAFDEEEDHPSNAGEPHA